VSASSEPLFIDTAEQLQAFCTELQGISWLALDTEFLRERTFYPKFCLLQVATDDAVACIDPIALQDLEPILSVIYDPNIIKIFHSGRQDLEIFYHLSGEVPAPLFDTQSAAPLLGMAEQISYAGLVEETLGVTLTKGHARTDWSRRPLSPEQMRYAADDVIYLGQAYHKMLPALEKLGRLEWLQPEFEQMSSPSLYRSDPENAWLRIGGAQNLKGKALSILQRLAAWREQTAQTENLPRGWLLKDDALFDLARQRPATVDGVKAVRGIDDRIARRHGGKICQIIEAAASLAPLPVPLRIRSDKKGPHQEALLDLLMAVVRLRAAQNTLSPSVLAGRKDLEQLLEGDPQGKLLQGWRRAMVGEELLATLRGELSFRVLDGSLLISSA
jgi:ribonuclease D